MRQRRQYSKGIDDPSPRKKVKKSSKQVFKNVFKNKVSKTSFQRKVFNKEVRFGSMGRPPLPHPCASIVQLFLAIHIISSSGSEFFFESLAHVSIRLCLARELKGVVIPTKIDLSFYNLFLYCRASYRPGASSSGSTCCLI